MKKLALCLMTVLMVLAFTPINIQAAIEKGKTTPTTVAAKTADSPEAAALTARLHEIKVMDQSHMNSVEKRNLRHETRSIKGTLNTMSGDVIYISAGGLLLIIVLLVILF